MKAAEGITIILLLILTGLVAFGLFGRPGPGVRPIPLEYQVGAIPDGEWGSTARDLGAAGWDIVSCRRASDGEKTYSYECIMKRPRISL